MKTYKEIVFEQNKKNANGHIVEGDELFHLQKVLLDIYIDVQAVCEKNNLTCMLLGGSSLGAVRHKGFIPWDDDLDIAMPRKDYETFKKIFKSELGNKYILNAPNYDGRPTNRFPKILLKGTKFVEIGLEEDDRACIKIDIFVLDNVPNNKLLRYLKGFQCTVLMFAGGHVQSYEGARAKGRKLNKRETIGKLLSFRSSEKWFDRFDKACRWPDEKSKFIGIPSGRKHYFGEILPRETYLPASVGIFEGHKIYMQADTDTYLKNLYGNYMEIPPENKREKHYIEKIDFGRY